MPITPFRERILQPGLSPSSMRDGTGERLLYTFGLMTDARLNRLVQGIMCRIPRSTIANNYQAPADALLEISVDRVITPGATESSASLAMREQRALDDWRLAGTQWGVLSPVLGALLAFTPEARTIATTFSDTTVPSTRISSSWATYAAGASLTSSPVFAYGVSGGAGDFDWDSLSPITGSGGSWSVYVVIYSVAPNDWAGAPQVWGQGSVYAPAGDSYYSTVSGGAYVTNGTYTGATRAWGAGSVYVPGGAGYYSAIGLAYGAPAYVSSGSYQGFSNGWGVAVSVALGQNLVATVAQRKPAGAWVRSIIVPRDATLFDPAQTADGVHNPAGTAGQWSIVSGGAYVSGRFSTAVYGSEVR